MPYYNSAIATLAFLAVFAISSSNADPGVHCGTTSDATFSDCITLINDYVWDANFNTNNICHYSNPFLKYGTDNPAYNVACFQNCCVYYASGSYIYGFNSDSATVKAEAEMIFGCADESVNKINGMVNFNDGHGVCISDGNGCGDCFDDADFEFTVFN